MNIYKHVYGNICFKKLLNLSIRIYICIYIYTYTYTYVYVYICIYIKNRFIHTSIHAV